MIESSSGGQAFSNYVKYSRISIGLTHGTAAAIAIGRYFAPSSLGYFSDAAVRPQCGFLIWFLRTGRSQVHEVVHSQRSYMLPVRFNPALIVCFVP